MKHAKIPLSGKYGKGKFMMVDVEDVQKVAGIKWYVTWNGYAMNRSKTQGRNTNLRAHRIIMDTPKGLDTDHINHDKLDNRKSNLKICTRSENLMNRQGAKGYYYNQKRSRWVVDCNSINVFWKQFKTESEAKTFVAEKLSSIGGMKSKRGPVAK